jgi:DNA-binding transcriptional MerR regulator
MGVFTVDTAYIGVGELARLSGLAPVTVRRLARLNYLPFAIRGGRGEWVFPLADARSWLDGLETSKTALSHQENGSGKA